MNNLTPSALNRSAALAAGALLMFTTTGSAVDLTWILSGDGNWNTTDLNWNNGSSDVAWTNGNAAIFTGYTELYNIDLESDITATSILRTSADGTGTVRLNDFSIDVPIITTTGNGSIDMYSVITGDHDLTYTGDSTAYTGRLNLKTSATYTGDTYLQNRAYLMLDGESNALPTTTTVNMTSNVTWRFGKTGLTQEIAGLSGSGLIRGSTSGNNTLTINTKSGVSTSYSGTIRDQFNIVIDGAGTQTLGSNLIYTGSTTVSGGTLVLSTSPGSTSSVLVNGGDLQSSTTNINLGLGAVSMSSGSITPNGIGSAGTFTVAADQNFTVTGGTMNLDVGTDLDQILGSGSGVYSIDGASIALSLGAGFDYGDTYELLSGFSSGSYSNVSITGYDTANYVATLDSSSGSLILGFDSIPEPSSIALIFGGLMGVLVCLKRRK
ncbi:PEP-CTERM sorting domain-containing protein [Cerasicoccus maritimus]|uniref:PEP-CTERM sorting domain-containing protein n=1 Tax=Cerasicoccus maritimus TaxID=490089 RepID=UPI002852CEEC|nr:PEP-CTERM sorting domain-containing protein [Cerasicoccus maritimus]